AKLVKMIGADGAIVTEEGFGNPDTDLVMNCRKLEDLGVKTVLITDEYAGRDGASQSLADAVPQANAVVSVGNANEVIALPACRKIIGDLQTAEIIAGGFAGSLSLDGGIKVEIQAIMGSTNELGFSKLRGEGF
ncbi:MAG TPA: glycine/sarcosine/betaine reductase component B subunit, partial [Candidatus Limnocylindrales bacterium]|nr:glycine/sarcosine/betaine reductase component B subunit [Candidatus Limnocylindrales bacterium]